MDVVVTVVVIWAALTYLLLFFLPTSTKPQAWKLRESIMAATVLLLLYVFDNAP